MTVAAAHRFQLAKTFRGYVRVCVRCALDWQYRSRRCGSGNTPAEGHTKISRKPERNPNGPHAGLRRVVRTGPESRQSRRKT